MADLARGLAVGQAAKEVLDVGTAQHRRPVPVVGPGTQAARQPAQAVDGLPDVTGTGAAVTGQLGPRPPLRRLPQPRLADAGKGQAAAVAEHGQVPYVPGVLGTRAGQGAADMAGHRLQQRPRVGAADPAGVALSDGGGLLAAELVAHGPQDGLADLRPGPGVLLDPVEHLGHHQRRQAPQAYHPGFGDGGDGHLPVMLVQPWPGRLRGPPVSVVRLAQAVAAIRHPDAGQHPARLPLSSGRTRGLARNSSNSGLPIR